MKTFFAIIYGISVFQILYGGINYLQKEIIDPLTMIMSGIFTLIIMIVLNLIFDMASLKKDSKQEDSK